MQRPINLQRLTAFRIGGTPVLYFRPGTEPELLEALEQCRRSGLPLRVLGGGSNLLVDEGHLPFAVIHICSPGFDRIQQDGSSTVRVGAGVPTAKLLACCQRRGLGGLEFLAGLPGTVGGALAGNAGAWGKQVSDPLKRLWVVSPHGRSSVLGRSQLRFSYRGSPLGGRIVTQAQFQLQPCSPELIASRTARHISARAQRHPMGKPSAGCVFKNPPGRSAGRLLDLCGLKGRRVGDAQVSQRHANFIVNRGAATAQQVLQLIYIMKEAVQQEFDVELELEVQHWPARRAAA